MDPELQRLLQAYFESEPVFAQTYSEAVGRGDRRSALEWMYDHINEQPGDLAKFRAFVGEDPQADEETVALEQDLLERVMRDYVYPDLAADAGRRAEAAGHVNSFNRGLDEAIAASRPYVDGRRLAEEYAMADETGRRLEAAVNAEAAGQVGAIDRLHTDRVAALDPLAKERIRAADTLVAGINQSLESERDRLTAEAAAKGFVGSSSAEDAALLRATIGARQDAASTMGAAKVANATDRRGLFDETARGRASTEFGRLAGVRGSADATTGFRKEYFDGDGARRLDIAFRLPSLEAQRLTMMGAADELGRSGLQRSLQALDWFSGQPTMPTYSMFQQQASQVGRDIAGLGAGITGAAINFGNANKWWQTPKSPASTDRPVNPYTPGA